MSKEFVELNDIILEKREVDYEYDGISLSKPLINTENEYKMQIATYHLIDKSEEKMTVSVTEDFTDKEVKFHIWGVELEKQRKKFKK